ncbi:MAG: hypothetical protein IT370_21200, partial [Deltaproteobacteria bacterium]|nr:hypothetical protein [Deltaproteobacteria bacterium]
MASRLSSLLVHDGLVSVKQMSEAFQRQVIYGGALDTIILEMGILGEVPLTAYLAQAAGLPPATPELLGSGDPVARGLCALEVAEEHHAVPLSFEGEALRLLVADPVDIARLEALATRLQRPVQPYVTPEFRVHEALQAAYGLPMPPRFDRLAGKFGRHVPAMPLPTSAARVSQKLAAVVVPEKPVLVEAGLAQQVAGPAAVTAQQPVVAPPDELVVPAASGLASEDALRASLAQVDVALPGPASGVEAVPLSIHEMATQQLTPLTREDVEARVGRTTEQGFAPLNRAEDDRPPSTTAQGFAVRADGSAAEAEPSTSTSTDTSTSPSPSTSTSTSTSTDTSTSTSTSPSTSADEVVVHPEEEMDGEGLFVAMGSALGVDAEARLARAIEAQLADVADRLPEGRIPVVAETDDTEPTVELTAETEGEGEAAGEITVNDHIPSQGVPEYSVVLRSGPHLIQPGVPVAIRPGGSGGAVAEPMPQRPSQRAASWRHRAGAEAAPMPASAAIARLEQCEERDEIFEVIA